MSSAPAVVLAVASIALGSCATSYAVPTSSEVRASSKRGASASGSPAPQLILQMGHGSAVREIVPLTARKVVLTASLDGTIRVWSEDLDEVRRVLPVSSPVAAMAAAADGSVAISSARDGSLAVWDLHTGKLARRLPEQEIGAWRVGLTADGTRALTAGAFVQVWDVETGAALKTICSEGYVRAAAISQDGELAACGHHGGLLEVWSVGGRSRAWGRESAAAYVHVAFSADGTGLVAVDDEGTVRVWDVRDGRPLQTIDAGEGVRGIALTADRLRLATGHEDGRVVVWDVRGGQRIRSFKGFGSSVEAVAFAGDRVLLWAGGAAIYAGDLDSGEVAERGRSPRSANGVAWPTGGAGPIAFYRDAAVRWRLREPAPRAVEALGGATGHVAVSADHRWAVTQRWERNQDHSDVELRLLDLENESVTRRKALKLTWGAQGVALSADGRLFAAAGVYGHILLWDTRRNETRTLEGGQDIWQVALSADGKHLATAHSKGVVRLWDVERGRSIQVFDGHETMVLGLAFSPDSSMVMSGDATGRILAWRAGDGRVLRSLKADSGVTALHVGRDGHSLLTGHEDGTVALWNVETRSQLKSFRAHDSEVRAVRFAPDEHLILSRGRDARLHIRRLDDAAAVSLVASADDWVIYTHGGRFTASREGLVQVATGTSLRADHPLLDERRGVRDELDRLLDGNDDREGSR